MERPEIKAVIDDWIGDICTGLVTLTSVFNPSRIILGGGVMAQSYVLAQIKSRVKAQLSPDFPMWKSFLQSWEIPQV